MLFKSMTKSETSNWRKAVFLGFYVLLILLFIDTIFMIFMDKSVFNSLILFWTALIITNGYYYFLNGKEKRARKDV
ncbi:hypothetical protein BC6307_21705 [Sutcliffiella cohnii]|uniref:Uncharacterized protein n=1 Tax=Sutcliffiella cohnii TaxID=33932 RepID=A0A223KW56_9BACI|nr:hypothetical protein [Sutcliffiella cohnii]AST93696.1 hypothetical protein BC6307_21705 [Sutcliffiella cohnii]